MPTSLAVKRRPSNACLVQNSFFHYFECRISFIQVSDCRDKKRQNNLFCRPSSSSCICSHPLVFTHSDVHVYAHPRHPRSRTIGTTGVSDGLPSWTALEQWDFDVFAYSSDMLLPICARVLLRFASFGHFFLKIRVVDTGCRIPNNTEETIGFSPDRSPCHNNICHPPSLRTRMLTYMHATNFIERTPGRFNITKRLNITETVLANFLRSVRDGYLDNPYHNWFSSWSLFFCFPESSYFLHTVVRLAMRKRKLIFCRRSCHEHVTRRHVAQRTRDARDVTGVQLVLVRSEQQVPCGGCAPIYRRIVDQCVLREVTFFDNPSISG
jgi:hypothetical protein